MLKFDFQKNKYGKELLIDCLPLEKIFKLGTALKKTHFTSFYEVFFITEGSGTMWLERDEYHFMAPSVLLLPQALPRRWDITPGCNKIFGKNAQDIIKQELLLATKRELLNSAKSIAEISYEYNFSAPTNFIRFFKSRTGESPMNYRKLYAN